MTHEASSRLAAHVAQTPPSVPQSRSVLRALEWSARAGLALADQGLYAGAHFLLNVLLARWLSASDYGEFALVYSVFLLVGAFYSALILEPMAVYGSGRYRHTRRRYLGVLIRGHLVLTIPIAAVIVVIAFVARSASAPVAEPFLALGLTAPLLLLAWLTRRAFYLELRPAWAAAGNVLYFLVLLTASMWLLDRRVLSPVTAIVAMALASAVASTAHMIRLSPEWSSREDGVRPLEVAGDHWAYGRWALASALLMWFPLNIYYYVLPASSGLEDAGALKAVLNLANPMLHSLVAVAMVLTPMLVRERERGGVLALHRSMWRVGAACVTASAAYLLLLWQFRFEVVGLLYGDRYAALSNAPVLLAGLLPIALSATVVVGSALRALEEPKLVFWSYAISTAAAVVTGIPLAAIWGANGALGGMLLSYVALAVAMGVLYEHARSRACAEAPPLASVPGVYMTGRLEVPDRGRRLEPLSTNRIL